MLDWEEFRQLAMLREEVEGGRDAVGSCLWNVKETTTVVVKNWATVPCVQPSRAPWFSIVGVEIDDGARFWRRHRVRVPIIFVPVELVVDRLGWIDARYPDEVERDDCLFGKLVP